MKRLYRLLVIVSTLTLSALGSSTMVSKGMRHGVSFISPLLSPRGACLFIASMPERDDSVSCHFLATYISCDGEVREIFPGFSREIATAMGTYSATTNRFVVPNQDFSRIAILHEYIMSGTTPEGSDVTIPITSGVRVSCVDETGNLHWQKRIRGTEKILASACRMIYAGNGFVVYSTQLGVRMYSLEDGTETVLPLENVVGSMVWNEVTGCFYYGSKLETGEIAIYSYDVETGTHGETGLKTAVSVLDACISLSGDGKTLVFIASEESLCVAKKSESGWVSEMIETEKTSGVRISHDGKYAAWQTQAGIRLYDTGSHQSILSPLDHGDAVMAALSQDGRALLYSAADQSGNRQLWRCHEIGNSCTLELTPGWDMYGLPFAPDEKSWNALKASGNIFIWQNGRFIRCDECPKGGIGFWFYAFEKKSLVLTGAIDIPERLSRGWNLILPELFSSLFQDPVFYTYDKNATCYVVSEKNRSKTSLKACWGYVK